MNNMTTQLLNKISMGLVMLNAQQEVVLWNDWLVQKTNKKAEDVLGLKLEAVAPKFAKPLYKNILQSVYSTGHGRFISGAVHGSLFFDDSVEGEPVNCQRQNLQMEVLDADQRYVLIQIQDVTGQHHKVQQMRSFIETLENEKDEFIKKEARARRLAMTDALTGLFNRRGFMHHLNKIEDPLYATEGLTGIVFMDLDHFKAINDTYGHAFGDEVLTEVGHRLKHAVRSTDIIARIGGDEFTFLLTQVPTMNDLLHIGDKIAACFNTPFIIEQKAILLSASFGISVFPLDGKDPRELLDKADLALYKVKKAGKSGFTFFSDRNKIYR